MGIEGLSSTYLTQMSGLQQSTKTTKAEELANSDLTTATDDELMDACKEFESYLLEQVFKEMEKTTKLFSDEEESSNSSMVDYFMDSTLQDLSKTVTDDGSLGIAQTLYESMKRQLGTVVTLPTE